MPGFQLQTDPARRRVSIQNEGPVSTAECEALAAQFRRAVQALGGQGLTVLVDIRQGQALPPDGRRVLAELLRWGRTQGVERTAVVATDPLVALQYRRMNREAGGDGGAQFFTVEEAEAYLGET